VELDAKAFILIFMMVVVSFGTGIVLLDGLLTEEKLIFVDFDFMEQFNYIFCEFRNVGTVDVVIVEVLLDSKPYFRFLDPWYRIPVGETQCVCCIHEWKSHEPHTITLVTNTGKFFSKTKQAPQRYLPLEVSETIWNSTDNTISIVVENIDMRDQNISGLGISDDSYGYRSIEFSEISCSLNISVLTEWDWWVTIPASYATTFVVDWPYRDPWTSGKTYFFIIYSEPSPYVYFNTKAP